MAPVRRGREEEEEAKAAALRAAALRLLAIARGEDPGDAALDNRVDCRIVVVKPDKHPSPAQPQDEGSEERHTPFHQEQELAMDAVDEQFAQLCRNGPPRRGLDEETQQILAELGLRGPEGYHPSLPPPSRMELHTMALWEAMTEMRAHPDPRYDLYSWEFFKAYLLSPRPVDPSATATDAPLPELAARYPYLADEVARLTRLKTAEQREAVGRGLLQADAAKLASLEERFREAVWAGKNAMVGKLSAEVRYAKARLQAEAMAEKIKAASSKEKP